MCPPLFRRGAIHRSLADSSRIARPDRSGSLELACPFPRDGAEGPPASSIDRTHGEPGHATCHSALRGGIGVLLIPFTASAERITGEATYRERIALPPDAVFKVVLEDISLADAPAKTMGSVHLLAVDVKKVLPADDVAVGRQHPVANRVASWRQLGHRCPEVRSVGEIEFGIVVIDPLSRLVDHR